jgi:DNA-binding SARP family transcriptional activator
VEFRLLGRFEAEHEGALLTIGRRQERLLLALLLLEANRTLSTDRLTGLLWETEAPAEPRRVLQTYVSRVRAIVDPRGDGKLGVRIVWSADGYLAEIDPDRVDALRFRELADQARALVEPSDRAAAWRRALALWRGPLLAGTASDRLRDRLATGWDEARLGATEAAIDAELACGRHAAVVAELSGLCAEHPRREELVRLLMLALYRGGRQAEALAAFSRLDRRLRAELGVGAGPELCRLQQRILVGDAGLLLPRAGGAPLLDAAAAITTPAATTPAAHDA